MSEHSPLGGPQAWAAVTARAGGTCECRGECGRPQRAHRMHPHEVDLLCTFLPGWHGHRLYVLPIDPGVSEHRRLTLAAEDLRSYCQRCADGMAVISRRLGRERAPDWVDVELPGLD
jgi:hypothetical protein